MTIPKFRLLALLCIAGSLAAPAAADETKAKTEPNPAVQSPGIVWYATLDSARAEAKRSGKPILLISAAPHCRNISGMW